MTELERVRILVIGPLGPVLGGTTVSLRQLVDELRARADVTVETIDTGRGDGGRGSAAWTALRVAWQALARIPRSDVVTFHASTPGTVLFGPIVALESWLFRKPLLVREFGGSFDVESEAMGPVARWLIGCQLRSARFLFQTHRLVEHFRSRYPGARCEWYSNSRPLREWPAEEDAPGRPAERFVFVGHVKPAKGIPELLEAGRRIAERGCRIDVYGPLLEGITGEDFRDLPNVRYRGELAPGDVVDTLRSYDAVVLPTYHFGEGYPGVILEAYVAGRPVVTTRWASIPEIVADGESGLLVPPRDGAALADALVSLQDSPQRFAALARGAAARAGDFSSAFWTGRFVEICREELAGARL